MTSDLASTLRWAHQANIERYEKLLRTHLTAHERRYVERRVAEEREALEDLSRRSADDWTRPAAEATNPAS